MSEPRGGDEVRSRVTDRTLDLLQHTSSSVAVHLEQVEGWLQFAHVPGEPDFWRVDAVTGPVGSLADAWGRLTLLSRVTDSHAEVEADLTTVMDGLVGVLKRLLSGDVADDEIDTLRSLAATTRDVYARAVLRHLPSD